MQFNANLFLSLALALSASAAPLVSDATSVVANGEANVLEKRDLAGLTCQRRGPAYDRAVLLPKIDAWCAGNQGWEITSGSNKMDSIDMGDGHTLRIGTEGINGCTWNIDVQCYYNLRKPVDKCNEGGENGKQGGVYEDQCARWHLQFI